MRILVVSQYYYPEPFRINEICEELVRRGHDVTVFTANPNYPDGKIYKNYRNMDSEELINGVKIIRCKSRPRYKGAINLGLNYLDFVIKANHRIGKLNEQYDCIYAYQLSPVTSCLPALKLKKKKNIPVFLYCLDVWPESLRGSALGNPIGMKLFGALSKHIYRSADKLAVTSPAFKTYISRLCDLDINSIQYIPQHSLEVTSLESSDVFKDGKVVNIVFMGNIGEAQNLECLLNAVAQIDDRSKFKIHIVGSGSYYKNCVDLANQLKIKDTVIFYGRFPKDEMPKFYYLADVCFVSLRDEGVVGSTIPGKVQEYMSAGKPILACMNGDTAQVIHDAKCGICVPADDKEQLAEAIIELANRKSELEEMGINAKKYYEEYFTLGAHVDALEKCIGKLLK